MAGWGSGTTYFMSDAVPVVGSPTHGTMAYTWQGYDIKTGKKVGGVLKDSPFQTINRAGVPNRRPDEVAIFGNGDSLTKHERNPYSVQRVGKIKWSVGSVDLPAHYMGGNENQVLVRGQSEVELVVLDSLTGKTVGDPIPLAGTKFALCNLGVDAFLPDKLAALQCYDTSSGGLVGYIISLP